MVLYGSSGNSGKITMSPEMNPSQILLSRGSVDKFVISLSQSLGTLHHAYIWHDNTGETPSWFLDYIIVKDRETGNECKMVCNRNGFLPIKTTEISLGSFWWNEKERGSQSFKKRFALNSPAHFMKPIFGCRLLQSGQGIPSLAHSVLRAVCAWYSPRCWPMQCFTTWVVK